MNGGYSYFATSIVGIVKNNVNVQMKKHLEQETRASENALKSLLT